MIYRVGIGYDIHPISEDRPLYLGGVKIADNYGLVGHSDADVLLHSIIDAILGALNMPDIGIMFTKTPENKGIRSTVLLHTTAEVMFSKSFRINNVDSTICAEYPRLYPYFDRMRDVIAGILQTPSNNVSIKATSHEELDTAIGKREAMSSYTIVMIRDVYK
jgi:2-C-methyl-D-erythritol 2,4-cyclodiphosphate synthase